MRGRPRYARPRPACQTGFAARCAGVDASVTALVGIRRGWRPAPALTTAGRPSLSCEAFSSIIRTRLPAPSRSNRSPAGRGQRFGFPTSQSHQPPCRTPKATEIRQLRIRCETLPSNGVRHQMRGGTFPYSFVLFGQPMRTAAIALVRLRQQTACDPALPPPPNAWYAARGRSAVDGRLANPVRSGRKQPQRVTARVVCRSPTFPPSPLAPDGSRQFIPRLITR